MRPLKPVIVLLLIVLAAMFWNRHAPSSDSGHGYQPGTHTQAHDGRTTPTQPTTDAFLPIQARETLALIARGGPFQHTQDGVVFGNYEGLLPKQPRGYYHEYTVETPGAHNRGARRIITGGTPPVIWYYTADHYRSFRQLEAPH
jgi:guanyl-specific ribonuclease Sa